MSCTIPNHCLRQPSEILFEIFNQLDLKDLFSCQGTCKTFNCCIKKYEDRFYKIFAEKAFFFFRRDGAHYFSEEGQGKNRFVADYTHILSDCRIKSICIKNARGLEKICLLQRPSQKKQVNRFFIYTWMSLLMKKENVQEKWQALIPLFKLGVIHECLASRLFMIAARTFASSKSLREKAYFDLFLFHKAESLEKDCLIWGNAAFHASLWQSHQEKSEFLEKGGEIAKDLYFERRLRLKKLKNRVTQDVISFNLAQRAKS